MLPFARCILGICTAAAMLAGCGGSQARFSAALATLGHSDRAPGAEQVLDSFTGGEDGGNAATGLALDRSGDLYGTTVIGGASQCGTVFKLTSHASPPWPETVIHSFDCYTGGKYPHGGATFDRDGNLDGTTVAGGSGGACGSDGCGIVFQLTPTSENVLHNFTGGHDGFGPGGGVVFDPVSDVYGTTPDGGAHAEGIVYELSHIKGHWHEKIIHAFTGGADGGVGSLGLLLRDAAGNLYGVTEIGAAGNAGTVFKLSRASRERWSLTTLYAFKGTPDAGSPYGGLIAGASGDLYGTTYYGGSKGEGTVFSLVPKSKGGYRERVLYKP